MDNMKIGKFIAELRKEKKLTQKELADKLFVSDRAISKWENSRGVPDISIISKLAEILEVNVSELLKGERIDIMNKNNADEIVKESIPFFQKKYFNKIIKKLVIGISIFLIIGYFSILCIGQLSYGELRGKIFNREYAIDLPSYSSKMAKNYSKKFLKFLMNYDYAGIENLIAANPNRSFWIAENSLGKVEGDFDIEDYDITFEDFINNLKELEKAGVTFTDYRYNMSYHNGTDYINDFTLELYYKKEKYSIDLQLAHHGKRILISSYGESYPDTLKINNPYTNIKDYEIVKLLEKTCKY